VAADFSDPSGQFSASCFEDALVENFLRWAAEGVCVLLNVELDSPSPEEPPRITVRSARPLDEVSSDAMMLLKLNIDRIEPMQELALLLRPGEQERGEVIATLDLGDGRSQQVRLGRDFALDGELVDQLALIEGIANVSLTARKRGDHLRLVA